MGSPASAASRVRTFASRVKSSEREDEVRWTMPIRRTGLHEAGGEALTLPVVYVRLPDLTVELETISYTREAAGISLKSPVAETTITVDSEGFILDYPGLAERI